MGWVIIEYYDKPTIISKIYPTPEEAVESIIAKVFEDLWNTVAETRHYRGGVKIENDQNYTQGYRQGLYPIYKEGYTLEYFTYSEMIHKIATQKTFECWDSDGGYMCEYYIESINLE